MSGTPEKTYIVKVKHTEMNPELWRSNWKIWPEDLLPPQRTNRECRRVAR
jgi:hypothetical protein